MERNLQQEPPRRLAYNLVEAARLLGDISLETMRAFVKQRRIKAFKAGRRYMIRHEEIAKYVERQTRERERELVGKPRRRRGRG